LELFGALYAKELELFSFNFGEIILLPNVNEEEMSQHIFLMLELRFSRKGYY
jgi:hypothetical protein